EELHSLTLARLRLRHLCLHLLHYLYQRLFFTFSFNFYGDFKTHNHHSRSLESLYFLQD
ncbi:unnamed protein product, partial [Brassica rapa subsp. trilocularis]